MEIKDTYFNMEKIRHGLRKGKPVSVKTYHNRSTMVQDTFYLLQIMHRCHLFRSDHERSLFLLAEEQLKKNFLSYGNKIKLTEYEFNYYMGHIDYPIKNKISPSKEDKDLEYRRNHIKDYFINTIGFEHKGYSTYNVF